MKTIKLIAMMFSVATIIACKSEKKEKIINTTEVVSSPKTYAEISIAEGGKWIDGERGHKEYDGGTSFKNVTELRVPDIHTDHTWYLRYEGPGWESNKVGYRLYLDWRNAIDIFGKKTDSLILSKVGQDGFDSYHEPQSWGQDILKVGKGLGIGSIGRLVDTEMFHFKQVDSTFASIENSLNNSKITINYKGWETANDKIDLKSILSINSDSRITKHTIQSSKAINGIVTGIVDHKVNYLKKESENKKWAYIATYGKQTLVPDNLGMAIFYEKATTSEVKKGEDDYLIEFKPTTESIVFYFLAAWEQEPNGIKTENEFLIYLNEKLSELNTNNTLQ
ncbi:DUF4861 domain-containing protein [Polaribacter reichenbachii]|uniref:Glycoside hydrolase n=1 Tax=Polaribacter reichenbachii TaxID=996801 RepID=A0A1B8TVI9_9FLAO|nr:DUF4861 family protein [Polaribacter reichenbachii]APZ45409.1 DUF4861 domain-containing protein [Polaribacter reichenbachii]AUC19270.1 DUF4861 domain-containing protein [Polaribacter reichenbachii]OBY63574.1 glycoside hydrolase [Polaribacter reichenbachii]